MIIKLNLVENRLLGARKLAEIFSLSSLVLNNVLSTFFSVVACTILKHFVKSKSNAT